MKYQDFEKGLGQKVGAATAPVDIETLLANIHSASPTRRPVWPWIGLFAVLTLVGLWGLDNVIGQNHQQVVVDEANMLTSPNIAAKTEIKVLPAQTEVKITDEENNPVGESSNITKSTVSNTSNNTLDQSKVAITEKRSEKSQLLNTKNSSSRNLELSESSSMSSKATQAISNSNTSSILASQRKYFRSSEITSTEEKKSTANTFTSMTPDAKVISKEIIEIRSLESVDKFLAHERLLPVKDYVECPTFSNKMKWHFDLIAEVGYILPQKSLSNNTNESSEILASRLADESSLEGIQTALYARVRPGNAPYYLKFGASYTRLSERMDLSTSYVVSDTTVGIISIVESQNGDTLTVIRGDIISDTTYLRTSRDHYYLNLLDIPVAVGYSQSIGGGWRLGAEVGAQFNISLSSSGRLLESVGQDAYTELPASGRFSPNVGVSFFGGITLEKAISANSSFYISPRFRYFPQAFTPESYGTKQEYQFAGIHAGYIHSF